MKLTEIQSTDDIVNFIEGCLNDFATNESSQQETIGNIVDLIAYCVVKSKEKEPNYESVIKSSKTDPLI